MHRDLVDLLADPDTGAPLRLDIEEATGDHIETGGLTSPAGVRYPIVKGIPRFVPPATYADNFGMQWNRFRATQLDTEAGTELSEQRFDAETGWTKERLAQRWVLDAGCGAGRFAEVAARRGARVVAVDLSSAVEATAETLRRYDNVDVVQASLLAPPFKSGAFDFAYCIGVVQHTPDPPRVIRECVRCVRPRGEFAFTVYGRRPWTLLNGKYTLRNLTRRLPPEKLLAAVERTMPTLFPLTDRLFSTPVIGRFARFAIPVATYTESERPSWTRDQRYQEAVLDTFDMLAPHHDHPMTWREVERELRACNASTWNFNTRIPVNVIGTR